MEGRDDDKAAGGIDALKSTVRHTVRDPGFVRGVRSYLRVNQTSGFDCPGCAWPDPDDRARARARGRSPGGMIMIHGLPDGLGDIGADHTTADWTDGCIAVTNEEIEEIWDLVDDDTPIHILP